MSLNTKRTSARWPQGLLVKFANPGAMPGVGASSALPRLDHHCRGWGAGDSGRRLLPGDRLAGPGYVGMNLYPGTLGRSDNR